MGGIDLGSSSHKKNPSKFNYTDFVDQALVNSIHNTTLDMSNPQLYRAQHTNPLVRASLNGVISHRIKNLLGGTSNLNANYSQQSMENQNHLHVLRMQAAQSMLEHTSNEDLSPLQGSKILQSARKKNESKLEQGGYESLRQDIGKG